MRTPSWPEIKRVSQSKLDSSHRELLSCPLDNVERVRGRIEAYSAVLRLETEAPADLTPATSDFFDTPLP